jgi:hypothetical protein
VVHRAVVPRLHILQLTHRRLRQLHQAPLVPSRHSAPHPRQSSVPSHTHLHQILLRRLRSKSHPQLDVSCLQHRSHFPGTFFQLLLSPVCCPIIFFLRYSILMQLPTSTALPPGLRPCLPLYLSTRPSLLSSITILKRCFQTYDLTGCVTLPSSSFTLLLAHSLFSCRSFAPHCSCCKSCVSITEKIDELPSRQVAIQVNKLTCL